MNAIEIVRNAVENDRGLSKSDMNAIYDCELLASLPQSEIITEFMWILQSLHKLNRNSEHYVPLCRMVEYIIKRIFPEFRVLSQLTHNNPYHYADIFCHTMDMLFACETDDPVVLLTILFHDIGKIRARVFDERRLTNHYYGHEKHSVDMTAKIMIRMGFADELTMSVVKLVRVHDFLLKNSHKTARKLLSRLEFDLCLKLIEFQKYDKAAHRWNAPTAHEQWIEQCLSFEQTLVEIHESEAVLKVKDLAISGKDLLDLGYEQGILIGEILQTCVDYVIDEPERNNRDSLIKYVESNFCDCPQS